MQRPDVRTHSEKVKLGLGILGLGVQGRRMLARLAEHDRLQAVAAWDPEPARCKAAGIAVAQSPEDLMRTRGVDCVYIASPPAVHMAQANLAFDAGKPVLCEKPLSVDFEEARQTIARIERERQRAAVNFSLAASTGMAAVQSALEQDELGKLRAVEIEVWFKQWPRPWQAEAGAWLSERTEGGFTREVLSHFVFALQRALGKAVVEKAVAAYPQDGVGAETGLSAELRVGSIPVKVSGHVGSDEADYNRFALVGERATIEFFEWLAARRSSQSAELERAAPDARPGYLRQLDHLAAFIEGRAHLLPDFAEALAVQETIEAMLSSRLRATS